MNTRSLVMLILLLGAAGIAHGQSVRKRSNVERFSVQDPSWFLAGFGRESSTSPGSFLTDPENQLAFRYSLTLPLLLRTGGLTGVYAGFSQHSFWFPYERARTALDNTFTPELFGYLDNHGGWHIPSMRAGYVHQSNGLGSGESRTWNRWLVEMAFGDPLADVWQLRLAGWVIFNDHDNPDVRRQLGDGRVILFWQPLRRRGLAYGAESVGVQLESGWGLTGRGGKYLAVSGYLHPRLISRRLDGLPTLMVRWFTGRGESLSRYNRDTHSLRVGLVLFPQR